VEEGAEPQEPIDHGIPRLASEHGDPRRPAVEGQHPRAAAHGERRDHGQRSEDAHPVRSYVAAGARSAARFRFSSDSSSHARRKRRPPTAATTFQPTLFEASRA
jgi:hypothetical protein